MKFTAEQITQMVTAGCPETFIEKLIGLADEQETPQPKDQQPEQNQPTDSENEKPNTELEDRIKVLEEQNKTLTEQLAAAQHANINQDQSGHYHEADPVAELADFFRKG